MTDKEIRTAFENWAKSRGLMLGLNDRGDYHWGRTQSCWEAFQAAIEMMEEE